MTDPRNDMPGASYDDDDLDLLDALLAEEGADVAAYTPTIVVGARPGRIPLSFSQELIWMLDRATPGLTAYNMPMARRLSGPLDVVALERALTSIVARHEILRTRLPARDGEPEQVVDVAAPVVLRVVDVSGHATPEQEAERVVRERGRVPFDLEGEHMFRCTLVRLAADDHVLLVETHHIAFDGWSGAVLLDELSALYANSPVASLPLQYADFAIWQREQLAGARLDELMTYWRAQLGGTLEPLALPTDHPRNASVTFAGGRKRIVVSPETLHELKALARKHDATLYQTLLTAYMTVLHRYSGRQSILVGSGSAGRTHVETELLIGYFANTLVVRGDFSGDPTFAELLARVRDSALGAYDHQDVPLEKLVLELRDGKDRLSDAPLFEVVFTMQNTIEQAGTMGDVTLAPFGVDLGATKFDLTLLTTERDQGLALAIQYRSDLFDESTIERLLDHLRITLESAVCDANVRISAMPLLSAKEEQELAAWNATTVEEGFATTMTALIEASVARAADRVAVTDGERSLTYGELDVRANQLAHRLRALVTERDAPVALYMDRSVDAIIGLVGILRSGSPYVPIAADLPAIRLAQRIAEGGIRAVVTLASLVTHVPSGVLTICLDHDADTLSNESVMRPDVDIDPDALAYILYTSGSTGVPKGVGITHRNIVHYTRAVSRVLGDVPASSPGDGLAALDGWTFGLVSTLGADLGNTSLFPALCSGGTLVVLSHAATMEPAAFADAVAAQPLDVLKITPNHLQALMAGKQGADLARVLPKRWIITGGEALRWDLASQLLGAMTCRVLNHYGPTEATVGVCTFEITAASMAAEKNGGAQTAPVGSPLANTTAHVLDAHLRPMPVGIPGELYLGGSGIAAGYIGQPLLTAEKFLDDPFAAWTGARLYRTGDRVRRRESGRIEFLGRADDQVKVRGYRLELGDVEHELRQHSGVADCVVVARLATTDDGQPAETKLAAYVVWRTGGYDTAHVERPTVEKLTEWLRERVPDHMVPSSFTVLDALPLSANGKVDKHALPEPDVGGGAEAFVAPRTETETALAMIWQDVLKKDRVGITDDFLALGGHSLLAIRVLGKISKQFAVRLPLRSLFDSPTVEKLAVVLDAERSASAAPAAGITARARDAHRIRTEKGPDVV
ncbi:MAG: amino acid adenylation domain-containing protein [Gemmatimonadaceae bacterium]